jgi:hypothetical protein
VSALEEQQFLLIHATADGEDQDPSLQLRASSWMVLRVSQHLPLLSFTEKIHFQHTAELITQLIKDKANYSLQVPYACSWRKD